MKTKAKETSRKTSIQIYLEPAQRKQFTEVAKRKGIGEGTLGKIVLNARMSSAEQSEMLNSAVTW